MKLKKHICKHCWKKYYENDGIDPFFAWTDGDERRWKNGEIYCLYKIGNAGYISEIPEGCPYALEHMTQEDKDK